MSYETLEAALLGTWKLQDDAASTVLVDGSGNGLNGTLFNAGNTSAATTTGPTAWLPKGIAFDATNDYAVLTTDTSVHPGASTGRSYEAWVKCRGTGEGILFKFGGATYPWVKLHATGVPIFQIGNAIYRTWQSAAATTLQDGNWHHVVFTASNNTASAVLQMYLDGVLITPLGGANSGGVGVFSTFNLTLANANNVAAVAGVCVHPVVLSDSEVAERFAGPTPVDTTPPTVTSASINAAGTEYTQVHDEIVTGGAGGLTITPSGGAATLTYLSGSGTDTLVYSISRVILASETVTRTYISGSGNIVDAASNALASFTTQAVTNNSTVVPDTTPPTLSSATVTAATTLTLVFDEPVTLTDATGWTVASSGASATLTYASGDTTNTLLFTISRSIVSTESLAVSYNSGTGNTTDIAANALATISNRLVTNNINNTPGSGISRSRIVNAGE